MTELPFKLSDIRLALKRKGLNYKLNHSYPADCSQETLNFSDVARGTRLKGKVSRSFNEGEVYHWPQLCHENIVPLIDVLSIRDDLKVFLTADLQMKLKSIVHEADFVYDFKCFDRKREYARGIFSGLSYLHEKSLCLMNLSDENIFICKVYDRAIITNFSNMLCSGRTTKASLKVCELYRAPEAEKAEFDSTAAEIWASGTLMLDLFLAHMVPWAVVDYKPARILEIVDKLSMELFQAASAGSNITIIDLTKFKAFLRCFFKENPCMRITARYASIASFLKPKFENNVLKISPNRKVPFSEEIRHKSKKHFIPCYLPEPPVFSPHLGNMKQNSFANTNLCKHCLTLSYPESEPKNYSFEKIPKFSVPYSMAEDLNWLENDERHFCLPNIENPSDTFFNYKGDRRNEKDEEFIIACGENANRSSGMFLRQKESSKSCQEMVQEKNILAESSYIFNQSKSLSFIKPAADDSEKDVPFPVYHSKNGSYSSIKSLPLEKSNSSNWHKSDLCLNLLFGESESSEEVIVHEEEVTQKICDGSNAQFREDLRNLEKMSLHGGFEQVAGQTVKQPKDTTRHLYNQPDIQRIIENILFLRKCQVSLLDHLKFSSNKEFMENQRNLINDYRRLLGHERKRLYEVLRTKYSLNIDEIIRIISSVGTKPKYHRTDSRLMFNQSTPDSSYELPAFKFVKYTGHNNARIPAVNCTDKKFCDCNAAPSGRVQRTYSYRKAIEQSECSRNTDWGQISPETEDKPEDKCTEKDAWPEEAEHDQKPTPNSETVVEKHSTKVKKKKIRKGKNVHRKDGCRPFCFFSWCPFGKIHTSKESIPLTDDLCETCKVNHKAM